jgi:hypothetical protein
MSLDGYIAAPDGGYDWIVMDPEIDFDAMFKKYDTVLMGRKSYDAAKGADYGMPKPQTYVFSKTLQQADVKGAILSSVAGTINISRSERQGHLALGRRRAVSQSSRIEAGRCTRSRRNSRAARRWVAAAAENEDPCKPRIDQ